MDELIVYVVENLHYSRPSTSPQYRPAIISLFISTANERKLSSIHPHHLMTCGESEKLGKIAPADGSSHNQIHCRLNMPSPPRLEKAG